MSAHCSGTPTRTGPARAATATPACAATTGRGSRRTPRGDRRSPTSPRTASDPPIEDDDACRAPSTLDGPTGREWGSLGYLHVRPPGRSPPSPPARFGVRTPAVRLPGTAPPLVLPQGRAGAEGAVD